MAQSRILGPDGQPIELNTLTEEVATGGLTSIRQVWHDSIASGLTPSRVAGLLARANQGDADDLLTLAEEMEERDPHYAAVLGVRKRAVTRLPVVIEAPTDNDDDAKITDFLSELIERPAFGDLKADLLDALGKPYSVCELLWDRGKVWTPRAYPHRDARWFRYDRETGRELRMIDESAPIDGLPLPAFKFIVHQPRVRTGLQIRAGLARLVAFTWLCKQYALKDWLAFAEVFGMPLRLGRYGPNATPDDIRVLRQAVASLGADAAAVMPESMKIEFVEAAAGAGGHELYQRLADFLDRQTSKAVLGQTMTTDAQASGLGSNQAGVHDGVRDDILHADVRDIEVTLNRDWLRPIVDLNFGPRAQYPRLRFHIAEPEDLQQLADALTKLVPLGLEVEQSVIRDKFGLPEPAKGKDVKILRAPSAAGPFGDFAGNARRVALNAAQQQRAREDQLADLLAREGDAVLAGWVEQVRTLVHRAGSLEEIRDGLLTLFPDMDAARFGKLMQHALTVAGVAGMSDALDDSRA